MDSKICNLWKQTCKLQKNTPSTFIHNKHICNISSIKQKVYRQAILELVNSLNQDKNRIYNQSTLIHCQVLQNETWTPKKIWNILFSQEFLNYHEIYNKFYIAKIINIAHEINISLESISDTELPIMPKGREQMIEKVLSQYGAFKSIQKLLSLQSLNNNHNNPHIRKWLQTATLSTRKQIMSELLEYLYLYQVEQDSLIKKPKTIGSQYQNPYNLLSVLNLYTNAHTMLTTNIIDPYNDKVVNITGRLIKK